MTEFPQALLKAVLETCRRYLPREDVHYIHTSDCAIETAVAYLASSVFVTDDADVVSYTTDVDIAIESWLAELPPVAQPSARKIFDGVAGRKISQRVASPSEQVDLLRISVLEAISAARALASSPVVPELEDLLIRLTAADRRLRQQLEQRKQAFMARRYDSTDGHIDPKRAESVFRRMFPDHSHLKVQSIEPLKGLHSREVHFIELIEGEQWRRSLVIRRDRKENLTPGSVADEYEVMRVLYDAGLPVPQPLGCSRDPEDLVRPFVAMERINALPLDIGADPSADRRLLEMADLLARLHAVSLDGLKLKSAPSAGNLERHYLKKVIPYWESAWRSLEGAKSFAMEWALQYLQAFPEDSGDRFHLIHGDFTARQMLVDSSRVVALLDFELAGPGSPAEDLACVKAEAERVMPWDRFVKRYRAAGGVPVSPETLDYFDIFIQFRNIVVVSRGQDIFRRGQVDEVHYGVMGISWVPLLLDQLQKSLETIAPARRRL